jgi:N-acyl homoserine lactone hydrolase
MSVKHRYYAAAGPNRLARLTSVLLDGQFHEPLPVYAWAIEHPEGVIVIDTGQSADFTNFDYFPKWQHPYYRSQYRFYVEPQDEIGPQLQAIGISPDDVRWLVMTHAHFDHTGGLHHFPNAEVIFSRKEYRDVLRYGWAHFTFPSRWPSWLRVRQIDYVPDQIGTFRRSYTLTQAGDVRIVPTPGHTLGHQSVVLEHEGYTFFFGGDTAFDQPSLLRRILDAPAFDAGWVSDTRRRILDLAEMTRLVYLTTHDHHTPRRLETRDTLIPQRFTVPSGLQDS